MKYIMIIPDGLTDLPVRRYGRRTPLDMAKIPHIDYILKNGLTGAVKTVPDLHEPGSEVANLSLLGVNPEQYKIGRGALEALSQNIRIRRDETVLRMNFVTVRNGIMLDNTGGNIRNSHAQYLVRELNRKMKKNVKCYSGVGYRNLMVIKRSDLHLHTVPPHDILEKKIAPFLPRGRDKRIIIDLMKKANSIVTDSVLVRNGRIRTNGIWLWGEGHLVDADSFRKKYALKGAVISAVDIIKGIARLLRMDVIHVPGITGDFNTNYRNKAIYALKNLKKYDFIFIHVEATDEAGHKGDFQEKQKAIERIDRDIVKTLLEADKKFSLILLPDHPTPVTCRTHVNKEVPFIFYPGKGKRPSSHPFVHYSEKILKNPPVFIRKGYTFLERVFQNTL